MHTSFTDGSNTPEEMWESAIRSGMRSITFSEHVREETDWYPEFANRVRSLKGDRIEVRLGIETKAKDAEGTLDAPRSVIETAETVVGVVHRYPDGNDGLVSLEEIRRLGYDRASGIESKLLKGLLKNGTVDVLGHPFGILIRTFGKYPDKELKVIMEGSLEAEKAIEINTKYFLGRTFFDLLEEVDPLVSLGSDAHSVSEIARSYDELRRFFE